MVTPLTERIRARVVGGIKVDEIYCQDALEKLKDDIANPTRDFEPSLTKSRDADRSSLRQ